MRRSLSSMLLPLVLALAGVALIIVGQLDLDSPPASSLPPGSPRSFAGRLVMAASSGISAIEPL